MIDPGKKVLSVRLLRFFTFIKSDTCEKQEDEMINRTIAGKILRILIFSVCLLFNMAADVFKVLMAGKLAKRLTLHNMKIINKLSGTILIGFGLILFYGAFFLANKIS